MSNPSLQLQLIWQGLHHLSAVAEIHNLLGCVSATLVAPHMSAWLWEEEG